MKPVLYVGEEHVQVYDLWRRSGARGLSVLHVDFHCDMRGLLVDRRRRRAHRIDAGDRRMSEVDSGNFLGHAVMEGMVAGVRWVHDPRGGRRFDTGTVKYETDVTALPHRLLHALRPTPEVPFALEDLTFAEWSGFAPGEVLDIDWDGIGSIEYPREHIQRLADDFLGRDWSSPPSEAYLVYSPGYSHPDCSLFADFTTRLARRLGARVVDLPAYEGPPHHAEPQSRLAALERRVVLGLRRRGIY